MKKHMKHAKHHAMAFLEACGLVISLAGFVSFIMFFFALPGIFAKHIQNEYGISFLVKMTAAIFLFMVIMLFYLAILRSQQKMILKGKLLFCNVKIDKNTGDEQYHLGYENALSGSPPLLTSEPYLDGFSDGSRSLRRRD